MNFDETIQALAAFSGFRMQAVVSGREDNSVPLAMLSGMLSQVSDAELPAEISDAVGSKAVMFQFGDCLENHIAIAPECFVRGSRLQAPEGIEVVQSDGVIQIWRAIPWS